MTDEELKGLVAHHAAAARAIADQTSGTWKGSLHRFLDATTHLIAGAATLVEAAAEDKR